ncbi:MAG: prepilin-type cleavage/methylation domain-containing protein, partial [Epsilonproteobacteria bacterium]|nr:prepilin-type cleavage/methylation domain-containing protein [Campylobacterota bacterium]NPA63811.1 type II secretion system protein [Campylobacterota bacterium]
MTKRAFSLIEIIFVLILIGIVASIGSEIVFKSYENKLISHALNTAADKTRLALEIIAKRFSYRIPGTEVARKSSDFNDVV